MRIKNIIAIIIVLACWQKLAFAQNILPQEQITTHISEYCCLPGDRLWLSVYVSAPEIKPSKHISKLALVEFVDAKNNSLVRKKVLLNNGVGTCSLAVPDSIETGPCSVLVYTNSLKNFGEESYSVSKIMVFNPASYDTANKVVAKPLNELRFSPDSNTSDWLKIKTNKLEYATRAPVDIELESSEKLLSYSVSAALKVPDGLPEYTFNVRQAKQLRADELKIYPDYNGIVLSGRLVNKYDNEAIGNEEIVLSFPGEFVDVDYATTKADGGFSFLIPAAEGDKDMVFYLPSEDGVIQLNESYLNGFRKKPTDGSLQLNDVVKQFFTQRFIRKQLSKKFDFVKSAQQNVALDNKGLNFYGKVYQKVMLKNFEKLDSIAEYFYELTPTVHFPIKQGKQLLYLTNPETNFSLGNNPIVFIDGVYYPNWKKLAQLDHDLVEQINVIPKTYYYGESTYDGIVSIFTKTKNLAGVELLPEMSRMIYPLSDTSERFMPKVSNTAAHIPDLRDLLHWQSNSASNEKAKISFYTSDVEGEFLITLTGVTKSGKFVSSQKVISVKETY